MVTHVYFPPELITLVEVLHRDHQDIVATLSTNSGLDFQLGEVAAALGIALDGVYEVEDICKMLLYELDNRERARQGLPRKLPYGRTKIAQVEITVEAPGKRKLDS